MTNNIKSERARLNMTQAQLAEEIGVDAGTIARWEKGATDIPSSKAAQMSQLFKCSIDYIFGMSEERHRASK